MADYKEHGFYRINNKNIKISIIISYFSRESTIFKVIENIENQSLSLCSRDEIEVIIIDDGTVGENLYEKLPNNIIYLWQKKFAFGVCRARNTGAKVANGKHLVFLDADVLIGRNYIDAVLRGFYRYGERIVQCGYVWDYYFEGCPDPRTEFGVWENPDYLTNRFYEIASGNMAISHELYKESGGFDEDLIYGGVDIAFGYTIGLLPATAVYFNKNMESWHIPHPPSLAHAYPRKSWDVIKVKYPRFYEEYVLGGLR